MIIKPQTPRAMWGRWRNTQPMPSGARKKQRKMIIQRPNSPNEVQMRRSRKAVNPIQALSPKSKAVKADCTSSPLGKTWPLIIAMTYSLLLGMASGAISLLMQSLPSDSIFYPGQLSSFNILSRAFLDSKRPPSSTSCSSIGFQFA